jgi:hypothetical protein
MSISELIKLLEESPTTLLVVTLPLSLFAIIKMIGFLVSGRKNENTQAHLQEKLVEFAGKSIETTDLLRGAYDKNSNLQSQYLEQIKVISKILAQVSERLDIHDKQVDERIKALSKPLSDAISEVKHDLIRNATTKVVVRNADGKVISIFVAKPHKLANGENVFIIDILKKVS